MKIRVVIAAAFLVPAVSNGATIYLEPGIAGSCSNYDANARSCGAGSSTAYGSQSDAMNAVRAGDTLLIRGGTYGQLEVLQSGTTSQPITIKGHPGEVVRVVASGDDVGLWIINKSDVVIQDIDVEDIRGFGRLENSSRITIDGVNFDTTTGSGTTSALKFVRSTHNRVTNSSFNEGNDLMILQDNSNFNVIQGNDFGASGHSLISIRCSSQNVIRDNHFDNPDQKAMEIYDCEGISDAPVRLDDTKRNLLEGNRFYGTRSASASNDYNGIQHGGQQTIVRYNTFADNLGGGVNYQEYGDESLYVYQNRLYNNTFYNNRCYAIIGQSGPSSRFYDNRVVNNLLYANTSCSGGSGQVSIEDSSSVILTNNSLVNSDPGFENAANGDFRLRANSGQVDAGAFVTTASSSGSGTSLVVNDASWFYDGFGIAGEQGDTIRVEGQQATARILAINYSTNTLTLDSGLSWSGGAGVHVGFTGDAPDVGSFELGILGPKPMPPSNLQAN